MSLLYGIMLLLLIRILEFASVLFPMVSKVEIVQRQRKDRFGLRKMI